MKTFAPEGSDAGRGRKSTAWATASRAGRDAATGRFVPAKSKGKTTAAKSTLRTTSLLESVQAMRGSLAPEFAGMTTAEIMHLLRGDE
ncbi:MAG TPA: hypothetical protein DDX54_06660 [Rhodospirillaceae bacterium]|jgi:hypothetical protein|nr:hypothetical protein [Alphaproteobacteria bacterium]HBH27064.1 hypothetical protein [Rhodospirillaceae bacterium]